MWSIFFYVFSLVWNSHIWIVWLTCSPLGSAWLYRLSAEITSRVHPPGFCHCYFYIGGFEARTQDLFPPHSVFRLSHLSIPVLHSLLKSQHTLSAPHTLSFTVPRRVYTYMYSLSPKQAKWSVKSRVTPAVGASKMLLMIVSTQWHLKQCNQVTNSLPSLGVLEMDG